ncbi:MAG TPA: hypothetical protein VIA06_20090 [Candidatus Dormibacteraeota bacterium]|nr:hypothetical protein [Candidatus Dormibacteraeota bacterium]
MTVITRYEPLVRTVADAALTLAVIWSFYRIMWQGSSTPQTSLGLRSLVPRVCLAALLINFALPLVQSVVDVSNAVSSSVRLATGFSLQRLSGNEGGQLLTLPGLPEAVLIVLLGSYLLLALSYVVRYVLLVILTVLAPAAALLLVVRETQHLSRRWMSLFLAALFSQPLQLFVLSVGAGLDASGAVAIDHVFALASVFICFKIPGALRTSSTLGTRAGSLVRRQGRRVLKLVTS